MTDKETLPGSWGLTALQRLAEFKSGFKSAYVKDFK